MSTHRANTSKLASAELVHHLKRKLGNISQRDLANLLGVKGAKLAHIRKESTKLSALQVANALVKAHKAAQLAVTNHAIKPIVEFFPIETTPSGKL